MYHVDNTPAEISFNHVLAINIPFVKIDYKINSISTSSIEQL